MLPDSLTVSLPFLALARAIKRLRASQRFSLPLTFLLNKKVFTTWRSSVRRSHQLGAPGRQGAVTGFFGGLPGCSALDMDSGVVFVCH